MTLSSNSGRFCIPAIALGCGLLATPADAAQLGDPVDRALAVHISNDGLSAVGDAVAAILPSSFPVEGADEIYACSEDDVTPLAYTIEDIELTLSTDQVAVTTADSRLDLIIYATLNSTESSLVVAGDCGVLTDLDETCSVQIPTTAVQAHIGMMVDTDGAISADSGADTASTGGIDVIVDTVTVDISPIGNPLDDCSLASAFGTLLGQDENAVTNIIIEAIEPSLEELAPTIEQGLEDALGSLDIETELSVGDGAAVTLEMHPSKLEFGDSGIILGFSAAMDLAEGTDVPDCVDTSSGIDLTDADWPDFSGIANGTTLEYDAALFVGRDFTDQLLYTMWATGFLCIDAGEAAGLDFTAGFFASMLGDEFGETFEDDAYAELLVVPATPPTSVFSGDGAPIRIDLTELGLHMGSELDARMLRVFQVDVATEVGIEIDINTSAVNTALSLDEEAMYFTEAWSDLLEPGYAEGLATLVPSMISGVLPDDMLPSVELPSLMGIKIETVVWVPTEDDAWQGAYALLDTSEVESLEISGCSASSIGCGGESTDIDFDIESALGCDESSGCEDGATCAAAHSSTAHNRGVVLIRGRLGLLLGLWALLWMRREE